MTDNLSARTQETVADVVREMRAFKNLPQAKRNVSGAFVAGVLGGLANRIEKAHRRETKRLDAASPCDAAAMRDALEQTRYWLGRLFEDGDTVLMSPMIGEELRDCFARCRNALAAGARNCDRFGTVEEAHKAYGDYLDAYLDGKEVPQVEADFGMRTMRFGEWLMAEAEDGK